MDDGGAHSRLLHVPGDGKAFAGAPAPFRPSEDIWRTGDGEDQDVDEDQVPGVP